MTKSQNTKNEQLTEQWKKGELPSGWYWVEGCRDKEIYAYTSEYLNHMYRPKNGDRIIEQVPSYKEWKQAQERLSKLEKMKYSYTPEEWNIMLKTVNHTREQNAQLKELLKECKDVLYLLQGETVDFPHTVDDMITKIDEVLK